MGIGMKRNWIHFPFFLWSGDWVVFLGGFLLGWCIKIATSVGTSLFAMAFGAFFMAFDAFSMAFDAFFMAFDAFLWHLMPFQWHLMPFLWHLMPFFYVA
jgi:hypothetical protein